MADAAVTFAPAPATSQAFDPIPGEVRGEMGGGLGMEIGQ
jgi:hypothetical protein